MSYSRQISPQHCVRYLFLGAAALLAVASAGAQSAIAPNESSSNAFHLVAADGPDGGSGGSAARVGSNFGGTGHAGNWMKYATSNFAAELGAGFNGPVGNDTSLTTIDGATYGPFITWGANITAGGGVHLSKRVALLAEYQFIGDKLPGDLIYQLSQGNATGGNAHIWSFTLAPVVDLFPKRTNSIYLTGGGGFYRKVTTLTVPQEVEECYYYCSIGVENGLYGHISSNQGGVNFGFGLTHRLGGVYGDGKTKLFAEARYLFLDSPPITDANGLGTTELIPVTFGIRW